MLLLLLVSHQQAQTVVSGGSTKVSVLLQEVVCLLIFLNEGLPARSTVQAPAKHIPNPRRSPNPFSTTPESDWVHISHPDAVDDTGPMQRNSGLPRTTGKSPP